MTSGSLCPPGAQHNPTIHHLPNPRLLTSGVSYLGQSLPLLLSLCLSLCVLSLGEWESLEREGASGDLDSAGSCLESQNKNFKLRPKASKGKKCIPRHGVDTSILTLGVFMGKKKWVWDLV
jgi:hypothetical protein